MEKRQLKPALLAGLLTALVAACSAGNSTPAAPGLGSASTIVPATGSVDLRSAARFAILAGSTGKCNDRFSARSDSRTRVRRR
jgi:hypothetical protein